MHGNAKVSDEQIIATAHLPIREAGRVLGTAPGNVSNRRARLGVRGGVAGRNHPAFAELVVEDGVVLVGSDAHYWPGDPSTAHRAFVRFIKTQKPVAVILNGDVVDAATISRFPDIGWESKPSLAQEIAVAQERLREIQKAAGDARLIWTLGNHDMRFETRLASVAAEYGGIYGVHLRDHFPDWEPAWRVDINERDVVVMHRIAGGLHAPYNNARRAGTTTVTGHLHALNCTRVTNFRDTFWGVDGGTLAVPYGPQFVNYTEGRPVDWASGFVELTFVGGRLLWPELVHVVDEEAGLVNWRGKLMEV